MRLIDLFDQEDPKCLYCDSQTMTVTVCGGGGNPKTEELETSFACESCGEKFSIHQLMPTFTWFVITCHDLCLEEPSSQETGFLFLYKDGKNIRPPPEIPFFIPDFSDKDVLYNKLKTYLVFS